MTKKLPRRRKKKGPRAVAPPGFPPPGAYSEDGVDLTLIRAMLALTPAQRLERLQAAAQWVLEVRALNARS